MTTNKKLNVVQIDTETAAEIAKFQLSELSKGNEKPKIKDIVKKAVAKFLQSENNS